MFGGSTSPPKEKIDAFGSGPGPANLSLDTEDSLAGREKRNSPPGGSPGSAVNNEERSPAVGEKKRRSSSVTKAASFFSNARNSFHLGSKDSQKESQMHLTPLQKLGKMDPALVVPQGSLNNSAGESLPTSQSSFRVGVAEDKNRKYRRTMEDTHAYLYHFLGTNTTSPLKTEPSTNSKQSEESIAPSTDSNDSSHIVETDNGYFAIFDGHAGTFAAEWCGKKLHLILEDIMRKYPNTPVPELLDQTFTSVDQQLEKLPLKNSGCTAVAAVLRWEDRVTNPNPGTANNNTLAAAASAGAKPAAEAETQDTPTQYSLELPRSSSVPSIPKPQETTSRQRVLYTANVGDARIVLCRNGKALRLSYDHKGSDEHEGKRITNAGGLILNNRVNGVLAVTRALGDSYMKDLVTGHPYTTETVIQPDADEFIILACDGLWDVCSDQEAVDLVRGTQDPQAASKILVDHALSRFSTDNLSCMIVRLDSKVIQNAMDRKPPDQRTSHPNAMSETNKIIESAAKGVTGTGATVESKDGQTVADKIKEDILANTPDEEPGPEVSVPDETKDLAKVAGLNIRGKANIKGGKEEEDKDR